MKKIFFLLALTIICSACVQENPDGDFDAFYNGSAGIDGETEGSADSSPGPGEFSN